MKPIARTATALAVATLVALPAAALTATAASARPGPQPPHAAPGGVVYVPTNDPGGNVVRVYDRAPDGTLSPAGAYPTGGLGGALTGAVVDRLASQGSVLLDTRRHLLYVVNAGSDTLTVFATVGDRLRLQQVVPTGGDFPVSVTAHDGRVVVLNARGGGSIQGLVRRGPLLLPVPGWHRALGLDPSATPEFTHTPGQVAFSPDGRALLVTTKAGSNAIDVFTWDGRGLAATPTVTSLPGTVPFALAFDTRGDVVVAEAANAVATFSLAHDGGLTALASVPTGQAATCWVVADGDRLFVDNAGSATVSSYVVDAHGTPVGGATTATDPGPVDAAVSGDGRFLFVEAGKQGVVDAFRIDAGGTLTPIGAVTVPGAAGGEGIAAS